MWVTLPEEFGRDVSHLSPDETDNSKKSLYVIKFDDQQRNWNVPAQYYGIYWSADGPTPINKIAISLWKRLLGNNELDSRDSEDNIDGEGTEEGECYSGFACFGYGSIAISLFVECIDNDGEYIPLRQHKQNLLKRALAMVQISSYEGSFDDMKKKLGKAS